VGVAAIYGQDGLGLIPVRARDFLFTASTLVLGTTQPPIQRVPALYSPGIKQPVCEAGHSPSNAEFKNGGAIPPLPDLFPWRDS
jgi:hypothetical protein